MIDAPMRASYSGIDMRVFLAGFILLFVSSAALAEGEAVRAKGMAVADSIKARAEALSENQDAVIGQQLAEQWPAIVEAAAKPFGSIDQMIVLNGAQGLVVRSATRVDAELLARASSLRVVGRVELGAVLRGVGPEAEDDGARPRPLDLAQDQVRRSQQGVHRMPVAALDRLRQRIERAEQHRGRVDCE